MAHLNCSDEALISLRKAVIQRYGLLYGFLKKEVDNALSERAEKLICENRRRELKNEF